MQAAVVDACRLVWLLHVKCKVLSMTNNCKLCAHEIAFSLFTFLDHGARMSFAAQGHKAHMVFAALESPYSDKVVA